MRLTVAFEVALALGLLSGGSSAFVVPSFGASNKRAIVPRKVSGQGWDNDDFLGALSGGSNAMDEANENYKKQSRFQQENRYQRGKDAPPDVDQRLQSMPPGPPSSHANDPPPSPEDYDQGGSRFKEMLNKAQDPSRAMQGGMTPPQYTPPPDPYAQQQPQQQQQQQPMVPPPPNDLENLSVEEQARMFREFMAQQAQQPQVYQQQQPPPPPPARQMPGGVDAQGRRIGRNKDADSIANSADLYFAQLKRDSTVRTRARYQGDVEKANAAMADPSVKEIEESLQKNPYLTAQQERARSFVETSDDEVLVVVPEKTKTEKAESYAGVNFRKKMEEAKRKKASKKQGGTAATAVAAPESAVQEPVVKEEEEAVAAPPKAVASPPVGKKPEPPKAEPKASAPVVPATGGETDEDTRRQIRTLMGLMLKHRGGPGFGKGRLKAPEAQQFESLLQKTTAMLRTEAGMPAAKEEALIIEKESVKAVPATEEPVVATSLTTMDASNDALAGTVACVEGAIAMYENSAPADREGNLVLLRAALMAAVNTCNKVIAENEVSNKQAYEASVKSTPTPAATMEFPDTYEVAQPEELAPVEPAPAEPAATMAFPDEIQVAKPEEPAAPEATEPTPVASDADPNTKLLSSIYDKLKASSGSGQFGLMSGLSPDEANELADQLVDMRSVLMEELDSGIPESPAMSVSQPEPDTTEEGPFSKYQQMLARAKAAKQAKGGL